MQRKPKSRFVLWALLISAGLHGLAVLLAVLRPAVPPPVDPSRKPIELTVIEVPAPQDAKKKAEPATKPALAKREPKKDPDTAKKNVDKPKGAQSPSTQTAASSESTPSTRSARDARIVTLVPGGDFVVAPAGDPDEPHGHTTHNSPDEQPDPVAMTEYTGEKLSRKINGQVVGMLAAAASSSGLVDPYFMGARKAMEGDMSAGEVPRPKDKSVGREALKGYLETTSRYGATGNPLAPGELKDWDNQALARGDTQGMAMATHDAQWAGAMNQAGQSMAAMEATKRALDHPLMTADLELVQEPGGGISDSHIIKSSGYPSFDEYVLHHARTVFNKLDDPPETGHGISSAGWRSYWRFSYFMPSIAEFRGQRVRVELLRVEKGQGSSNPFEHLE